MNAARIVVIANPAATRVRPRLRAELLAVLAPYGDVDERVSRHRGDARTVARSAVADGATLVVTLGGDGLVNEVLAALPEELAVVTIPAGNANVFARAIGWPADARHAMGTLTAVLRSPSRRALRLSELSIAESRRVVVMNAGFGLDADAVRRVEARPWIKHRLRQFAFIAPAVAAGCALARRPNEIDVTTDAGDALRGASLVVACGWPYAFRGRRPVDILPPVAFSGDIAWRVLGTARPVALARIGLAMLRGGGAFPGDVSVAGVASRWIRATSEREVAVQVDGEFLGHHRDIGIASGPIVTILDPNAQATRPSAD